MTYLLDMADLTHAKLPVVYSTPDDLDQRIAKAKTHLKLPESLDKSWPVAEPETGVAKAAGAKAPAKAFCKQYGPEEWNLIFPEHQSEYGGIVCYRS
jgi:hypothetical protein